MNLLLDTHIFLWYLTGDKRLPQRFASEIQLGTNSISLSVVSVWEAVIKYQLGKLPLPSAAETYLTEARAKHQISSLPVTEDTIQVLAQLPPVHRDPFDRLIVAHALQHQLILVTVDPLVKAYPVPLLAE